MLCPLGDLVFVYRIKLPLPIMESDKTDEKHVAFGDKDDVIVEDDDSKPDEKVDEADDLEDNVGEEHEKPTTEEGVDGDSSERRVVPKMRCIPVIKTGSPSNLTIEEWDMPQPKDDEVLVKVVAFGLNFADTMAVRGKYGDAPKSPVRNESSLILA